MGSSVDALRAGYHPKNSPPTAAAKANLPNLPLRASC